MIISHGPIKNSNHSNRPDFSAAWERETKDSAVLQNATPPLRSGERSDNLPVVSQRRPTVAFCPTCGTQIADGASCPKCAGAAAQGGAGAIAAAPAAAGLADNVAGALAYVTIIPAILFLVLEPFNKKRFIRFHSFQCLFFAAAWIVLEIGLAFIGHIPVLGWATLLLWPLIGLAGFVIWLILVIKAYQGQMFKLPVIGDMAEQQAGA
jgi:uncharacterized membrane protein